MNLVLNNKSIYLPLNVRLCHFDSIYIHV